MHPPARRQSILDVLDLSNWGSLVILWLSLSFLMLFTFPEGVVGDLAALGVGLVGFTAAGGVANRRGWWWAGPVAVAGIFVGAVFFNWLAKVPYPVSDLSWIPFTSRTAPAWEAFGVVIVIGFASIFSTRRLGAGHGLVPATAVTLMGLGYLFAGWTMSVVFVDKGPPLLGVALTLLAVGGADELVAATKGAGRQHWLTNAAISVLVTGSAMVVAAVFWRIFKGPQVISISFGRRAPVNNLEPAATLAVAAITAVMVSVSLIRRRIRREDRDPVMSMSET